MLCVCMNCQSLHGPIGMLCLQCIMVILGISGTEVIFGIVVQMGTIKDRKQNRQAVEKTIRADQLNYILLGYLIFKLHFHELIQCQKTARSVWSGIPIPCHRCVIFYTFFLMSQST